MQNYIENLCEQLRLLSRPAKEQLDYLESIGGAPIDELALEFEEVMILAPQKLQDGKITTAQVDSINFLYSKLNMLNNDISGEFWTESALVEQPEWGEIRSLARDCLTKFE